ncbi:MAG TPA: signal peptidase II [Lacunisphaera sp.]|nr:signal peptidase II [Lacunisphaera sp.]
MPVQSQNQTQKSKFQRTLAYRRLWIAAILLFAADQITKSMIAARLPFGSYGPGAQLEIFPHFFNLVHVGNTGAAWSMFSGMSAWLGLLAVGTLVAMFVWRHTLGLRHPAIQPAFGLLSGGIVGNLVDRFRHGHVIDFLDFHFGSYIYPTFNIADSGICVGVFWYVLWSLRQPAEAKPES